MKFYICPKCACVNEQKVQACVNCNLPTLAVALLPNLRWLEFDTVEELDRWIELVKQTGGKVWRKKT